jgi:uncharacterized protein
MKRIILLLLIINSLTSFGQRPSSSEIIHQGIKLYGEGKYAEAIQHYRMVHENDSNYTWMLAELAMTFIQTEQYDSAIYYANKGLAEPSNNRQHMMRTLGTVYDMLDQPQKSIEIYTEAISLYPYSHLLHFNLGITYQKAGDFQNAMKSFQEALRCYPYHASSHMRLGLLMARQGQFTKALLSLYTFLAIEPHSHRSNEILVFIENLSSNYLDPSIGAPIEPFSDNQLFGEVDHLIKSKVALNPNYKSAIRFDANLIKQATLLFEVLPLETRPDDFWAQLYFPLYKAIKTGQHIEPFLYTILSSTGRDEVVRYLNHKRNSKAIKAFYSTGSTLSEIQKHRMVEIDGEIVKLECDYYDNGHIYSLGNTIRGKGEGFWQYFHSNGEVMSRGYKVNDKKEGKWEFFHDNGNLEMIENYTGGILHGELTMYHYTGEESISAMFVNGEIEGDITFKSIFGIPTQIIPYSLSLRTGIAKTFFPCTQPKEIFHIANNELHGDYTSYYGNGKLAIKAFNNNGMLDGELIEYHPNGQVMLQGFYKNGKEEGEWKFYHINGNLRMEKTFIDGVPRGTVKEYFYNGAISSEQSLNIKGQPHGVTSFYDHHGNKYLEEEYKNDLIVKITTGFNNPDGPVTFGRTDGTFDYSVYSTDGKLMIQGRYEKGKLNGEWKSFYKNGNPSMINTYIKGELHGKSKLFHPNGKPSQVFNYVNGKLEGEYISWTQAGKLQTKGHHKNNAQDYLWYNYYPNGNIQSESYLQAGEPVGWINSWSVDGKLKRKLKVTEEGGLSAQILFDQQGNVVWTNDFTKSQEFVIKHSNDQILAKSTLTGGLYHGTFTWFHPGGKVMSQWENFNGKDEGDYKKYYPDGKIMTTGSFVNDQRHGLWTEYHENGQKKSETLYISGVKDSIKTQYHENGKISITETWFNDVRDGELIMYDPEGELIIKIIYSNDEITGYQYMKKGNLIEVIPVIHHDQSIIAYYNNGIKSFEKGLQNFVAHGPTIKYFSNGNIMDYKEYKDGLIDGKSESFWPNGNPKTSFSCANDLTEGEHITYWENGQVRKITNYLHNEEHGETRYYNRRGNLEKTELYWSGSFIK